MEIGNMSKRQQPKQTKLQQENPAPASSRPYICCTCVYGDDYHISTSLHFHIPNGQLFLTC